MTYNMTIFIKVVKSFWIFDFFPKKTKKCRNATKNQCVIAESLFSKSVKN